MTNGTLSISAESILASVAKLSEDSVRTPIKDVREVDGSPSTHPTFPLEVFPQRICRILTDYQQHEGFNADFLCGSALAVFAAAMGNRWAARFSSTMQVSPILFIVLIGDPSSGKTPPLREMERPLQAIDMESDVAYNHDREEYDRLMQMTAKDRKDQGLPEYPERPVHHEILVIDSTIEKLFGTMKDNPHGILMFVNELNKLVANLNRYGKGSDEAYWIEFFDGNQVKYERKSSGDYVNILRPYVSVIGGTQPGLLSKMFGGDRESSGFTSRFLKVFPDITHMPKWGRRPMPSETISDWENIIRKVIQQPCQYDANAEIVPSVLDFSTEATAKLFRWETKIEAEWEESDSYMKGVCGKLKTYVVRFCLIIHVMRLVCGEAESPSIDATSAESACRLADYFLEMDKRVHNIVCAKPADAVHQRLFDSLPDNFTTAEAISLGAEIGMSERTVKRFLSTGVNNYLKKDKHGVYSKKE